MNKEQKKSYFTPEMKKIKLNNQVNLLVESSYTQQLSAIESSSDKSDKA